MDNNSIYNEVLTDLKKKYKKQCINTHELADELGVSYNTIRNSIKNGVNIPRYAILGSGVKNKYIFPVIEVARFLSDTQRAF